MRTVKRNVFLTISALSFSHLLFAQDSGSSQRFLIISLTIVGAMLLIGAIISLADNLLQIEAKKSGLDVEKSNYSLFPNLSEIFGKGKQAYVQDGTYHRFKKGHDIKLEGVAKSVIPSGTAASTFAVRPPNFRGLSPIPRMQVEIGDEVRAGDVLFVDKKDERIKYVAPVSGEVIDIRRGEKRAISDVVILADREIKYKTFTPPDLATAERGDIVQFLLESGGWMMINQRPFDTLPDPEVIPQNIFISTFRTGPLAPNMNGVVADQASSFQKGLDVLARLTDGQVHLGMDARSEEAPSSIFTEASGVRKHWFEGPHPSGNVGVQIHHIAPISAAEKVWTLGVQEVISLGRLFQMGVYDVSRWVAITGAPIKQPGLVKTFAGAHVGDLLKDNLADGHYRVISGDVLSGATVGMDGFMDLRDDQLTVVKEGDYYEPFGWLLPISPRPSVSNTFPNFLFPNHEFEGDTNTHGERRAFVMSGQYEAMLPMDIYPQHLMKAIMAGDFERMEGLGILELSEEDVALCEFACTSKMPLQSILRDGLDMMMEQG